MANKTYTLTPIESLWLKQVTNRKTALEQQLAQAARELKIVSDLILGTRGCPIDSKADFHPQNNAITVFVADEPPATDQQDS